MINSCKSINLSNSTFIDKGKEYKTELIFTSNNQFKFKHSSKLSDQTSEGVWERINDDIYLNSYEIYKDGVIKSEEKEISEKIKTIIVEDQRGNPMIGLNLKINNEITGVSDKNGVFKFESSKLLDLEINYLGKNYFYKIENPKTDYLKLIFKSEHLSQEYFNKEKLTLYKNYIIWGNQKLLISRK